MTTIDLKHADFGLDQFGFTFNGKSLIETFKWKEPISFKAIE